MSDKNQFGSQVEYNLSVTLKRGDADAYTFQKTGYGANMEEAIADAQQKLEADGQYQMMIFAGARIIN